LGGGPNKATKARIDLEVPDSFDVMAMIAIGNY
jgi:hypothetical protein